MKTLRFKHSVPIQLRFNDTDSLGHINNSVYFSFYDLGKTSYFLTVCGAEMTPDKIDVVIAHVDIDFLEPIFLNDKIAVQTAVSKIGTKSFVLDQRIITLDTQQVKCTCSTVMVGYDFKKHETIQISDEWRLAIANYEEHVF